MDCSERQFFLYSTGLKPSSFSFIRFIIEETLYIHFNEPTTAFLFSHNFQGTDIFSKENHFSLLEVVQKLLPSFIKTNIIEYG